MNTIMVPLSAYFELTKMLPKLPVYSKPVVLEKTFSDAKRSGNYVALFIDTINARALLLLIDITKKELSKIRKPGIHRLLSTFTWLEREVQQCVL